MKELYTKQVRSEAKKGHVVPASSLSALALRTAGLPNCQLNAKQGPCQHELKQEVECRIVQWNLNCLCGIDGQTPQRASDVIKVLAPCNADVLVLQEALPRA